MTRQVSRRRQFDVQVGSDIRKPAAKTGLVLGSVLFVVADGVALALHAPWIIGVAVVVLIALWWLTPGGGK